MQNSFVAYLEQLGAARGAVNSHRFRTAHRSVHEKPTHANLWATLAVAHLLPLLVFARRMNAAEFPIPLLRSA